MSIEFSIIIPVYKVEQFLGQCVDSVLEQTYKNYEIVLVDDGSPDNCPQICDNYADKYNNIKVVHKENGGLSDARNVGLKSARGEYIIFLDSDDYWEENNFLEKIIKFLKYQKNKDLDIILFQAKKFIEEKGIYILDNLYQSDIINSLNKEETIKYLLKTESYSMQACTKIIKRKFLIQNKIQFTKGLLGEDLDWFLDLIMKANNIYAIDSINYVYRIREGSITQTIGIKNMTDCIWMLKKWTLLIKKSDVKEEIKYYYYSILAYAYVVSLLNYQQLNTKNKKEIKTELKSFHYLLKYHANKRIKITNISYKIVGFEITSKLLSIYYLCKGGKK